MKPKKFTGFPVFPLKKPTLKQKDVIGYAVGDSSIGFVLTACFELGVIAVITGRSKAALVRELRERFAKDDVVEGACSADKMLRRVIDFIEKPGSEFKEPVYMQGTFFQKRVWQAVQQIPVGQTATYGEIARQVGSPRAMRAVGNTCSRNNLDFIVPCHRVWPSGRPFVNVARRNPTWHEMLMTREIDALAAKTKRKKK